MKLVVSFLAGFITGSTFMAYVVHEVGRLLNTWLHHNDTPEVDPMPDSYLVRLQDHG